MLAPNPLTPDRGCTRCPLHKGGCKNVCILGTGPIPCDILVCGEAPGAEEDEQGAPFVGNAGQLLTDLLRSAGFARENVYLTNAVQCRPVTSDGKNKSPTPVQIKKCGYWLELTLKTVKPRYILALGSSALRALTGETGIRAKRGRAVEHELVHGQVILLPTYHPAAAFYDDTGATETALRADLQRFREIVDFDGIPVSRELRPIVVDTWSRVEDMLAALTGTVSFDIETTDLYPWHGEVIAIGFGTRRGEYHILTPHHPASTWREEDIQTIVDKITPRIEDCFVAGHSGKFDLLWMRVHYGVRWHLDFDTLLAHHLLNENDQHNLEHVAQTWFGAPRWDIPLAEKQGGAPLETLITYHGHDLLYTRKLAFALAEELAHDRRLELLFRKLVMPLANLFVDMEYRGCRIDVARLGEVEKLLRSRLVIEKDHKGEEKIVGTAALMARAAINWGSHQQVSEYLYGTLNLRCPVQTPKGAPSTSESALKQLEHPIRDELLAFRYDKQQFTLFVEGWAPYLVRKRVHPSGKLHGTVTGRPSYEHPNLAQTPRDPRIRSLVIASPGYDLVEADLSQIELRIIAELSHDPAMRRAFAEGIDIHWQTALREIERGAAHQGLVQASAKAIAGRALSYTAAIEVLLKAGPKAAYKADPRWEQLDLRNKAKPIAFGYSYGMWWKRMIDYARDDYGIRLTPVQAQASRKAFFETYSSLPAWQERQRETARSRGQVRSRTGRIRRLPAAMGYGPEAGEAERQAINSAVQSLASDYNFMVLLQLAEEFPDRTIFCPVMTVYDAILAEVRKDHTPRVVARIKEIIKRPKLLDAFSLHFSVPIEGEVKCGPWGTGKVV